MNFQSLDGNLGLSPGSMGFLVGPGADGKGGFIAVAGAAAAILGGIAGAIGLGMALEQMQQ